MTSAWCARVAALFLLLLIPAAARASVEDAERLLRDQADFQGALGALEEAGEGQGLSRSDVVRMMELRAVVHAALRDDEARDRSLAQLRLLDPEHEFPEWVPPQVTSAFAALAPREPQSVDAHYAARPEGGRIVATLTGDGADLVRAIRISWRSSATDEWRAVLAASQLVPPGPIEYFADAIGPGGAVLWSAGSPAAPLRAGLDPRDVLQREPQPLVDATSRDDEWVVPVAVGATVGVVVIVAAVIVVFFTTQQPSPDTILTPRVDW